MQKTDHTAEIFSALNITPDTQPLLFYRYRSPTMENPETQKPISLIHTAGHELRADGLAFRLVYHQYDFSKHIFDAVFRKMLDEYPMPFAHAVHDALVEALGITEEET